MKKTIFILLIILLLYCFSLKDNNFDYLNIKNEIILERIENKNLFVNLKINDAYCSYDSISNTCYFYSKENNYVKLNSFVYLINNDINYVTINGFNLSKIMYNINDNNEILIYDDNYYFILNVKFTNIPIVNINDTVTLKDNNDTMLFRLYGNENFSTLGSYHIRGSVSFDLEKKSYKLELNKGYKLLGMDSDNDWVLDALYTDKSKIRNKLSSYVWNLINDNQVINNDLTGEFVEVFINDTYNGLYVLKEKVDKEITNVFSDGLLLKSVEHIFDNNIDNFSNYNVSIFYDNDNLVLENFEVKYYSDKALEKFTQKFGDYYSNGYSYETIKDTFDLNNYLNYKLFIILIGGTDNISKNQYLSMSHSNSNIIITPWDMDLTWGLYFDNTNKILSSFKMDSSYDINWLDNITNSMDDKTLSALRSRYWQLRKYVITKDFINSYLESYKELLSDSSKRDGKRWYSYDIEFEIDQIITWFDNRIDFLDEYFM